MTDTWCVGWWDDFRADQIIRMDVARRRAADTSESLKSKAPGLRAGDTLSLIPSFNVRFLASDGRLSRAGELDEQRPCRPRLAGWAVKEISWDLFCRFEICIP